MTLMLFSGAWGKMIYEKKIKLKLKNGGNSKKSVNHLPTLFSLRTIYGGKEPNMNRVVEPVRQCNNFRTICGD
jgi:hypothetical protein